MPRKPAPLRLTPRKPNERALRIWTKHREAKGQNPAPPKLKK